jgi:hypothetical protein
MNNNKICYFISKMGIKGAQILNICIFLQHIYIVTHEIVEQDKCPKYNGSSIILCQSKYNGSSIILCPTHYCVQQFTVSIKIQWVQHIASSNLLCQSKYNGSSIILCPTHCIHQFTVSIKILCPHFLLIYTCSTYHC